MRTFIRSIRLINAGFLLGIAFTMWIMGEEEKKKSTSWTGNNPSKMDDIYNNYKEKASA